MSDQRIIDPEQGEIDIRVPLEALSDTLGGRVIAGNPDDWRGYLIRDIVYDSRLAREGVLFLAISGMKADGHRFVGDAYAKGVRVFVTERPVDLPDDCIVFCVEDARAALAVLSARFFGHSDRELRLIGITGTKGKTTITRMLYDALSSCGLETASIGTAGVCHKDFHCSLSNTTPDAYVLHRLFYILLRRGVRAVVMEVSSSGLKLRRVEGMSFEYAVFCNLGDDHVSPIEHSSFEDYRDSKAKLFPMAKKSVLNKDDPHCGFFRDHCIGKVVEYSVKNNADYAASGIRFSFDDEGWPVTEFAVHGRTSGSFTLRMPGIYNVSNALAAIAVMDGLGYSPEQYRDALKSCRLPGRGEFFHLLPGIVLMNDYAHNGISMRAVLSMLTQYKKSGGRLIVLFGAVGGKAKNRRKDLALAVSEFADVAMVTSDCPYDEDPKDTIREILSHMADFKGVLLHETDRKEAIFKVVDMARKGDIVLFAGMGDDDWMTRNGVTVPYSENANIIEAAEAKLRKDRY